jgi:hypothetical protein
MAFVHSPKIVTDGLILALDAGNVKSYPGSGTTWYDKSGYGNNGTLTNGPTFTGSNGGSLVFDGTNDYVTIPYTPILTPTSSISFGGWAYKDLWADVPDSRLLSKTQVGGYQLTFSTNDAYIPTGNVGILIHLGGTYYATSVPIIDYIITKWNHFFATCDGRYIKLYINGNLISTYDKGSTSPITYSNNNYFVIGAEPGTGTGIDGSYFSGRISNILVYDRALSDSEVFQIYNAQKSRYPFERGVPSGSAVLTTSGLKVNLEAFNTDSYPGSGTTWYDISGNSFNATLQGTTSYSSNYIDLGSGPDITNYLTLSTSSLSGLTEWTIDIWMYRHSANNIDTFLSCGPGNDFLWFFEAIGGGFVINYQNPTATTLPYNITNATPFLFTAAGSGSAITIYKNGIPVGTVNNTTTITPTSTLGVVMGQEMDSVSGGFDANQKFKGKFGAIRFYNRKLTDQEVYNNYLYTLSKY